MADDTLDCTGLKCPLPRLKLEKKLRSATLRATDTLTVIATDPMARLDIPEIAATYGLSCTCVQDNDTMIFSLKVVR